VVSYNDNEFDAIEQAKKASAILLALGGSLSSSIMKQFEAGEIKRFADTATRLTDIEPDYLVSLVDELSEELKKSEPISGGDLQTRSFLEEALPSDRVRAIYGDDEVVPLNIWKKFTAENESDLVPYLLDQHPQTISYIVSNLDADLSSRVVSCLPRDIRNSVVLRLLKLRAVNSIFSQVVQLNLQNDLLLKIDDKSDVEGISRMAKLLNQMGKDDSDAILDSLKLTSPVEAAAIGRLLFSFDDILKLSQKDRLVLFDKVQTEKVMLALRGTTPELKESILTALGARARRMIEAELAEAPGEVTKEVVAARQSISEAALKLASEGLIVLALPESDELVAVQSEAKP
jgi:flagellar motor switch protein FliG